jgi:hypothetical protein
MSLQDFFCEYFEIEMRVPSEAFDKAAFLEDIKGFSDPGRKTHAWSYGSSKQPDKQHAHMYIDLRREKHVRIRIVYHNTGTDAKDVRPPYMEDCGQWIGQFLKAEEIPAELEALYKFDSKYSPIMGLPFPLPTARKELRGSKVIGVSVQPPRKMSIKEAIIQRAGSGFTVFITTKEIVKLKEFDLAAELERLSGPVMTFVYKTGELE